MNRLNGKVAIVTGAASGVDLTTVSMFLEEGAKVIATDINDALLNENIAKLENENVMAVKQDVTKKEDWEKVRDCAVNTFGKLDVLVNNAEFILEKVLSMNH